MIAEFLLASCMKHILVKWVTRYYLFHLFINVSFYNQKQAVTHASFHQLKPAITHTLFHQIRPAITHVSFHQLKPAITHASFHQLKPAITDAYFDQQRPAVTNSYFNQKSLVTKASAFIDEGKNGSETVLYNKIACGRSKSYLSGRIVGGTQSEYLKWPWVISLQRLEQRRFEHKCGATLLNTYWAITAAHCVYKKSPHDILLRLGEYNFHDTDENYPHLEMRVRLIINHPAFNPVTYENDLALLRFYTSVPQQPNIAFICLPQLDDKIEGKTAVVTGWGKLTDGGDLSGYLHEVHLPILANIECEEMYLQAGYVEKISDVFICAGLAEGGIDACEGDSGGPLMIRGNNNLWKLVGLISWGIGCAEPKQPGVYTRITKFVDWIEKIIF